MAYVDSISGCSDAAGRDGRFAAAGGYSQQAPGEGGLGPGRGALILTAFLMGFFSMAAQAILFREHLLAYSGNEIGIGIFYASWMAWIAVGALIGRAILALHRPGLFPILLLLYPLALLVQLLLFWRIRALAGISPLNPMPLDLLPAWTALLSAPVSLCTGVLFTVAVARLQGLVSSPGEHSQLDGPGRPGPSLTVGARHDQGPSLTVGARHDQGETRPADVGGAGRNPPEAVATVYGWEAAGGFAGGIGFTLAAGALLPFPWVLAAAVLVWYAGLAVAFLLWSWRRLALIPAALALAVAAGSLDPAAEGRLGALPIPEGLAAVEIVDSPYQNIAVARLGETVAFFSNGSLAGFLPDRIGAPIQAAVLRAMRPGAARILVLGFGADALLCELNQAPAESITYVGTDAAFLEALERNRPPELAQCLASPNLRVVNADVRAFLAEYAGFPFDLIVLAVPEPATAQAARFYTREFFSLAAQRLAADGIFTLSLTAAENVLAPGTLAYASMVHATLSVVFEKVAFTAGETMTFFAGAGLSPVTDDAAELEARLAGLSPPPADLPPEFLRTVFERRRIDERRALLEGAGTHAVCSDARPTITLRNLLAVHPDSFVAALVARCEEGLAQASILLLLTFLVVSMLASRGAAGPPFLVRLVPAAALAGIGLAAMAGQVVVVTAYQARFGSLLAEFGALNAAFMLGLAFGSLLRPPAAWQAWAGPRLSWSLAPGLASLLLLAVLIEWGGGLPSWLLRASLMAAPLLVGLTTGFALAAAARALAAAEIDVGGIAVAVEGLDHAGAMAGALLAGTLLVPAVALSGTLLCAAALVAAVVLVEVLALHVVGRSASGAPRGALAVRACAVVAVPLVVVAGYMMALGPERHRAKTDVTMPPKETAGGFGDSASAGATVGAGGPGQAAAGPVTVSSRDYFPQAMGYGGPLELVVRLDAEERILSLRLGRHNETPEYLGGIDSWLAAFAGKQATELVYGEPRLPDGVDALSGATVTGRAVVEIARAVGQRRRAERLNLPLPTTFPGSVGAAAAPASGDAARPVRKDNAQYPYQRDLDARAVKGMIEEGRLSDHEASHYLRLEPQP